MNTDIQELSAKVQEAGAFCAPLLRELSKAVVGQKNLTRGLLAGLLADGHLLLEGLPGLAKTTAVRALADAVGLEFSRIQFTPDLLPADLVGTTIYNAAKSTFEVRKGPLFSQLVLADEINRAPSKVQSALLEAMQERQITIGDETFRLDEPFLVLATQNPIEQEGTYPLPEAQVDRFMLKLKVGYPTPDEERRILDAASGAGFDPVRKVVGREAILAARAVVRELYVDDRIKEYVVRLVGATRRPADCGLAELAPLVAVGASPRASIDLARAAKANAFVDGRAYVTPEDVKAVGLEVLRHSLVLSYEAEAEEMDSDEIVQKLFAGVEVP